jgi:hypothetical protein
MNFEEKLRKIVAEGLVPTVECSLCHYQHCFFEGSVKYVEQAFSRPCERCGGERIFYGIFTELE